MGCQPTREDHREVVQHVDEYGDASFEVSSDVREHLVLLVPGNDEVRLLTPAKALELAAALVGMVGTALGVDAFMAGCECHQLVRVAQAVDNLLGMMGTTRMV